MPDAVRSLHMVHDGHTWAGRAKVTRGNSVFGKLLCWLIGFPPESDDTPLVVMIERRDDKEFWTRRFGHNEFKSVLSLKDSDCTGRIRERFGVMRFDINLQRKRDQLHFPVVRGTFLGVSLPTWLLPLSEATETSQNGEFHFDIKISLPGVGMLVRYQGSLTPARAGN